MATITEDYVSFELAKLLKDKGFDEYTFSDYSEEGVIGFNEVETRIAKGYQRPTLQMAMKWLRNVHNINIDIETCYTYYNENENFRVTGYEFSVHSKYDSCYEDYKICNSYEQACEAAIRYCLENLI
jgi:hypothetical protein